MTSFPVILNQSNAVGSSTFTYRLPQAVDFSDIEVALSDISIYYSWRSITSSYNNNKFSFTYPGSSVTTYNITLPDGTYTAKDLDNYLKFFCIQNNLYLINTTTGDYKYYITIQENPAQYALEFISYPVGITLESGYSAPAGHPGFPATNARPQLIINNEGFSQILGFSLGTYPAIGAGSSAFSKISDFTPQLSPVQSVIILLDAVINPFASNSGVIGTINSKGTSYGSLISYSSPEYNWLKCQQGQRQDITVRFTDQNFRPLEILDTNLTIRLLLKKKSLLYN
jgi:hypothetical protein